MIKIKSQAQSTQLAITLLATSSYEFHLTGSRFFGCANNDSDWDYFTKGTKEVLSWLKFNNFECIFGPERMLSAAKPRTPYSDFNTSHVFRMGRVDVQLVYDVKLKMAVQNVLLKEKVFHDEIVKNKQVRASVWIMVQNMLTYGTDYVSSIDPNAEENLSLTSFIKEKSSNDS